MEPCSMKSEIDYIKKDIVDIKVNAKEQAIAMATMRDNHIETKIYIKIYKIAKHKCLKTRKKIK